MWIAACSSPSPSPTPSPSQAAIDVVESFTDALLDPSFTATADISGSITVDAAEAEITGSAEFDGPDMFQEITLDRPGGDFTQATLTVDGEAFTRTGDGPWVRQEAEGGNSALTSQFNALLADLEDEGLEDVDGESLHHLVPPAEADLDAAAFGITDSTITDFSAVVDFYATPQGEPAVMQFTLTWAVADQDAEMLLRYELNTGARPTIKAPDEAWLAFSSDRFSYGIAYPEDWVFSEAQATEEFRGYDFFYSLQGTEGREGEIQVYGYSADEVSPYTASDWYSGSGELLASTYGVDVEFTEPITVAGIASRYFSLHYVPEGGGPTFVQEAVIYTPTAAWDIDWYSDAGTEQVDRETFDLFLATFASSTGITGGASGEEGGSLWDLAVGECFNSDPPLLGIPGTRATNLGNPSGLEPVSCDQSHAGETTGQLAPGSAATCEEVFADYVGRAFEGSSLGLWTFVPVDATYTVIPDLPSVCVVAVPSGSRTGSVAGSGL